MKMKVHFNKIFPNEFKSFEYVRRSVRKPRFHTFWLLNVWEVKAEIRFCIEEYVHTVVYLAKIAKYPIFQHLIMWPEVTGTIIFHRKGVLWVYLKLSETILHYKSTLHGDFHIFEKNWLFEVRNFSYKKKIANFTNNSCLNQMIVLLEDTSIRSSQHHCKSQSHL